MKTLFCSLALTLLCAFTLSAQTDKYSQAMLSNLAKIDSAKTTSQKMELSNAFERIAKAEKDKWQAYYYAAMLQIFRTYQMKGNEVKNIDEILDKADALLISAEMISPDNSEILCMQSMAASARIAIDPMARGAEYGGKSSEILKKAIEINPNNPRAYLLLAQSAFYTPAMWGGGKDKAKPMVEKSIELFESFKPDSKLEPNWGKSMANNLLVQCNK